MKTLTPAVVVLAAVLGAAAASAAFAHPTRVRTSVGFYVGVPFGWPYWGPYPYYYPYPERVVVVPSGPTEYVERPSVQAAPEAGYWYYCAASRAYYPYVRECAGGWQRVAPRPPGE